MICKDLPNIVSKFFADIYKLQMKKSEKKRKYCENYCDMYFFYKVSHKLHKYNLTMIGKPDQYKGMDDICKYW